MEWPHVSSCGGATVLTGGPSICGLRKWLSHPDPQGLRAWIWGSLPLLCPAWAVPCPFSHPQGARSAIPATSPAPALSAPPQARRPAFPWFPQATPGRSVPPTLSWPAGLLAEGVAVMMLPQQQTRPDWILGRRLLPGTFRFPGLGPESWTPGTSPDVSIGRALTPGVSNW